MDYDQVCKSILAIDSKVRFAGICDENGETKHGGMREGLTSLLSPQESQKSNLQAVGRWGLRKSLISKTGRGIYAMTEYEKLKRITIPIDDDHLLVVTTEVDADHGNIISSALKLVQE
ncbi:hypothetical protein [Candidatus Nitrosocosmicus sp. SS]|jgi:hypothetical protein|uniref:hypothetical protein n=1 Tax=Candidatus Nitrosocosmicus agrestis TaxID=2563600 RepID=UPI00122E2039|nr:hypothetical protein [Candidatus Nitrosocosmicus sp. SS]KAA2280457.1 hypothetical protein F1Z66_10685 [Candidatus Nitrosocosmicus sp. SS]KAF0869235.1 hypothetical protein E5N71_05890 [Candidatus Nitrosocosmicus sp. SS]MDR4492774.1 hypothetical protein [Candidatus Nitrosocosmicus sp.]